MKDQKQLQMKIDKNAINLLFINLENQNKWRRKTVRFGLMRTKSAKI